MHLVRETVKLLPEGLCTVVKDADVSAIRISWTQKKE